MTEMTKNTNAGVHNERIRVITSMAYINYTDIIIQCYILNETGSPIGCDVGLDETNGVDAPWIP